MEQKTDRGPDRYNNYSSPSNNGGEYTKDYGRGESRNSWH